MAVSGSCFCCYFLQTYFIFIIYLGLFYRHLYFRKKIIKKEKVHIALQAWGSLAAPRQRKGGFCHRHHNGNPLNTRNGPILTNLYVDPNQDFLNI